MQDLQVRAAPTASPVQLQLLWRGAGPRSVSPRPQPSLPYLPVRSQATREDGARRSARHGQVARQTTLAALRSGRLLQGEACGAGLVGEADAGQADGHHRVPIPPSTPMDQGRDDAPTPQQPSSRDRSLGGPRRTLTGTPPALLGSTRQQIGVLPVHSPLCRWALPHANHERASADAGHGQGRGRMTVTAAIHLPAVAGPAAPGSGR
jgi:hypothetical protein